MSDPATSTALPAEDKVPAAGIVRKLVAPDEVNGTPGERSIVVWMTTDHVDREQEVIVPEGIDFKRFLDTNPVVMAIHNYQSWPVGSMAVNKGGWIKLKKGREFAGLVGKVIFDTDPASDEILGKYKRDFARMVSVGVEPPADLQPGEWGPPTTEELTRRPDWAHAKRIIRRCVLTELSLCPIGMNPNAVVISKAVPVADEVKRMIEEATAEVKAATEDTPQTPESTIGPDLEKLAARLDALETILKAKGKPTAKDPDGDGDDDSNPETDTDHDAGMPPHMMLRAGHYVEWGKGMAAGCGKILSIHRAGKVPGVAEEVEGTEDEPAARVKCYQQAEERWKPTAKCIGKACKELARIPHPLDNEDEDEVEKAIKALPPHRVLAEVERTVAAQLGTVDFTAIAHDLATDKLYRRRGGI